MGQGDLLDTTDTSFPIVLIVFGIFMHNRPFNRPIISRNSSLYTHSRIVKDHEQPTFSDTHAYMSTRKYRFRLFNLLNTKTQPPPHCYKQNHYFFLFPFPFFLLLSYTTNHCCQQENFIVLCYCISVLNFVILNFVILNFVTPQTST